MKKSKRTPRILIILGTLAIILVPTGFTFFGWQTVRLDCARQEAAADVSCEVQNGYFLGLYNTPKRQINDVKGIGYSTSTISTGRPGQRIISTVVMSSPRGDVRVLEAATNVNDSEKSRIIREFRSFLEDKERTAFHLSMRFSNPFGWLGLPGLILLGCSVVYSAVRRFFPIKLNSLTRSGQ